MPADNYHRTEIKMWVWWEFKEGRPAVAWGTDEDPSAKLEAASGPQGRSSRVTHGRRDTLDTGHGRAKAGGRASSAQAQGAVSEGRARAGLGSWETSLGWGRVLREQYPFGFPPASEREAASSHSSSPVNSVRTWNWDPNSMDAQRF